MTDETDPITDGPTIEAEPADVAEQRAEVGPIGGLDETALTDDPEVPEADKLEQAQQVTGPDPDDER